MTPLKSFLTLAAVLLTVTAAASYSQEYTINVVDTSGAALVGMDELTVWIDGEVPWDAVDARLEYRIFPTGALAPAVITGPSCLQGSGGSPSGEPQYYSDYQEFLAADNVLGADCELSPDHVYSFVVYLQVLSSSGAWSNQQVATFSITAVAPGGGDGEL